MLFITGHPCSDRHRPSPPPSDRSPPAHNTIYKHLSQATSGHLVITDGITKGGSPHCIAVAKTLRSLAAHGFFVRIPGGTYIKQEQENMTEEPQTCSCSNSIFGESENYGLLFVVAVTRRPIR